MLSRNFCQKSNFYLHTLCTLCHFWNFLTLTILREINFDWWIEIRKTYSIITLYWHQVLLLGNYRYSTNSLLFFDVLDCINLVSRKYFRNHSEFMNQTLTFLCKFIFGYQYGSFPFARHQNPSSSRILKINYCHGTNFS